jgi:hypothetical protein
MVKKPMRRDHRSDVGTLVGGPKLFQGDLDLLLLATHVRLFLSLIGCLPYWRGKDYKRNASHHNRAVFRNGAELARPECEGRHMADQLFRRRSVKE